MPLATAIDWGSIAPLRLRARTIADGVYAGAHRSLRKGAGVEFGGHRPYVPGDDLRWLDRRAVLRHDRLIVREFETETDRGLRLVVDASNSMAFRGSTAPAAKFAYAALIAAALARVALASGDPVGLDWLGGEPARPLPAMAGREAFERIVGALEGAHASGDLSQDAMALERAFAPIARRARRGAIDLHPGALDRFVALAHEGRTLVAVQVLDPDEALFPFDGTVRLRALEGQEVVETDAEMTRARYLAALEALGQTWSSRLTDHGGYYVRATTADDATSVVRSILAAVSGRMTSPREPA
jgi:uncharacterized protein (DUF58 family)